MLRVISVVGTNALQTHMVQNNDHIFMEERFPTFVALRSNSIISAAKLQIGVRQSALQLGVSWSGHGKHWWNIFSFVCYGPWTIQPKYEKNRLNNFAFRKYETVVFATTTILIALFSLFISSRVEWNLLA